MNKSLETLCFELFKTLSFNATVSSLLGGGFYFVFSTACSDEVIFDAIASGIFIASLISIAVIILGFFIELAAKKVSGYGFLKFFVAISFLVIAYCIDFLGSSYKNFGYLRHIFL